MKRSVIPILLAGGCAGLVAGVFGAGGGLILVPLLTCLGAVPKTRIFSASLAVILPVCIVSLVLTPEIPWKNALPYCIGGAIGAIPAALWGKKIPTVWLHRALGVLILWGAIRAWR